MNIMKTNYKKVILLAGILVAVLSLWSVRAQASGTDITYNRSMEISIENLEDYFAGILDAEKKDSKKEIRIYNNNDDLIRVAREGSILLQPIIDKADFLLEVHGVRYYRISK